MDNQRIHAFWSARWRGAGSWSFVGDVKWKKAVVLINFVICTQIVSLWAYSLELLIMCFHLMASKQLFLENIYRASTRLLFYHVNFIHSGGGICHFQFIIEMSQIFFFVTNFCLIWTVRVGYIMLDYFFLDTINIHG